MQYKNKHLYSYKKNAMLISYILNIKFHKILTVNMCVIFLLFD